MKAIDEIRLCSAAGDGNLAEVEELLRHGVSPDGRDQRGSTPLFYAALGGHVAVAARLLEAGADINARNVDGVTALAALAGSAPPGMLAWLEARGAKRA